ncbi:MAG: hypothetical protein JWP35_277 [Caulobacter sp.]|nr:hypothetical protein [Caulobacter sp.]
MADGGMTLNIDEALAAKLKAAAASAGESVEDYARHALEVFADEQRDGVDPYDPAYLRALEKIAQDTVDQGTGVPLAEVRRWVESWGSEHELPTPK